MSNAECELVCRIEPSFQQSFDIIGRLRSYADERFELRLMESAPSTLLGEVRFRGRASGMPQLRAGARANDVRDATFNDIDLVLDYERQLRTNPMSMTYCNGIFTFGAILNCSKGHQDVAEQLLQQHAVAFLSTLGPFSLPDAT